MRDKKNENLGFKLIYDVKVTILLKIIKNERKKVIKIELFFSFLWLQNEERR